MSDRYLETAKADKNLQWFRLIRQSQPRFASAKKDGKYLFQLPVRILECLLEFLKGGLVDLPDGLLKRFNVVNKILSLVLDELIALFERLVLFDGCEIDFSKALPQPLFMFKALFHLV